MSGVDDLGDAGAIVLPSTALALVILPDPEVQAGADAPILGQQAAQRLIDEALRCGFTRALAGPGVRGALREVEELVTGDPIGSAALVVFESAVVHAALLRLMVEHPLEPGERFTLYDAAGRPTAWFTGDLASLPTQMPISEEIAWPEEVGPEDLARVVYAEDRRRAEAIVRRSEGLGALGVALWSRRVEGPLLRRLAASGRPTAQIELLAVTLAAGSGAWVLLSAWAGAVAGALCLLLGVEIARLLPALRRLRRASEPALVADTLVRPFGHASFTAALTYALVAEEARSGAADLVLLAIGGAAALFSLGQARSLLRQQPAVPLDLPSAVGVAERLGIGWPARWRLPLAIEVSAAVAALLGPGLAWGVMVAAGLARVWRWFASPSDAAPTASDAGRSRETSRSR